MCGANMRGGGGRDTPRSDPPHPHPPNVHTHTTLVELEQKLKKKTQISRMRTFY